MRSKICSAMTVMILASPAWSEEKRHADAHEHGHGVFQMVIEDDHAIIEMAVPAFDILGFEHAPSTTAQRAMMADAASALSRPDTLFAVPHEAECAIGQIEIGVGATGGHRHEHGGHDEEDHDEEKHDDHAHDDHDKEEENHSEVTAFYRLACANTDALDRIEFGYFDAFPKAEELEVVILSAAGQSAGEVSRDETVFEIE